MSQMDPQKQKGKHHHDGMAMPHLPCVYGLGVNYIFIIFIRFLAQTERPPPSALRFPPNPKSISIRISEISVEVN